MARTRYFTRIASATLIVPFVVLLIWWIGLFRPVQETLTDHLFTRQIPPPELLIVEIDERSITELGQWPLPRDTFGDLVRALQGASVIAIDVNFKESSPLGPSDDASFGAAIRSSAAPVVVTAEAQPDGSLSRPIPAIRGVAREGFPNLILAKDGVARFIRLYRGSNQSFALTIANAYREQKKLAAVIPPNEVIRIHYYGPDRTFAHISAIDLLRGTIPANFVKDKIVLIGATAQDLQDFHETPFGITSGVEIQANIVSTLLNEQSYTTPAHWTPFAIVGLGVVALAATVLIESISTILVVLLVLLILLWLAAFISFDHRVILDFLYPSLSIVLTAGTSIISQYVTATKEKRFIRETFSRYLAPQVIDELIGDPGKLKLGGQKTTLSILFSDVRSFTTLSEKMSAEQLTKFLNRYLSSMTDIILEKRGVIDKYIGDAIMAFWGAPLPNSRHAADAIDSALQMVAALREFNAHNEKIGDPTIDIGIGINSGEVTVGNMGSEKRFDYTVMGDNVNLASRLEGLTKEYGVSIIVSQTTADFLSQSDRDQLGIVLREIDRVQVKGKKQGVTMYQVVAEHKKEAVRAVREIFDQARSAYYSGQWEEAVRLFESIVAQNPADGPAQTLLKRCKEFRDNPPENWEGVYQMTHK